VVVVVVVVVFESVGIRFVVAFERVFFKALRFLRSLRRLLTAADGFEAAVPPVCSC
jgi:hypothetical protein